jgi:hypothetical protein
MWVFVGFLPDSLLGPPMPWHLVHVRCRQCLTAFCGSFVVRLWPQVVSGHGPLKGRLKGARPVQTGLPKNASLFVRGIGNTHRASSFEIASSASPRTSPSELKPYDLPPSDLEVDFSKERIPGRSRFVTIA